MDRRRPRRLPLRPLVLIVEHHEATRARYDLALPALGFEVMTARQDDDPCRRAWELHPDIIVTSFPVTTDDLWPFLRDLRRSARTREIPVVAVSGHVSRSDVERAERDGLAAFLTHPCMPLELASALRQVLEGHVLGGTER
jgi:FOG: CheY-like receiver